jgi:hypothetical protein
MLGEKHLTQNQMLTAGGPPVSPPPNSLSIYISWYINDYGRPRTSSDVNPMIRHVHGRIVGIGGVLLVTTDQMASQVPGSHVGTALALTRVSMAPRRLSRLEVDRSCLALRIKPALRSPSVPPGGVQWLSEASSRPWHAPPLTRRGRDTPLSTGWRDAPSEERAGRAECCSSFVNVPLRPYW